MTRSTLRRRFEEEPKYDPVEDTKVFKSKQLYFNIVLGLVVIFMCTMSISWMNADITGEYVAQAPEQVINNKNFPASRNSRYQRNTPKRQKIQESLQEITRRQGGTNDGLRLSITRGPLTMYGDLIVNAVRMNLISTEAPRDSKLDLLFETSEYDVKLGYPQRRLSLRGEIKDGVIDGFIQQGNKTYKIRLVRDGMASFYRRIQSSPLFGHWKWPWEQ